MYSLSHDVGEIAHDKDNQRFNDSGVTGVLKEEGCEPSNHDSNGLVSIKSTLLVTCLMLIMLDTHSLDPEIICDLVL